jgi:hypothetical protein
MSRAKPLVFTLVLLTALSLAHAANAEAQQDVLRAGQTISGRLDRSDPTASDGSHYDEYRYAGAVGDRLVITLRSADFDAMLFWGRGRGGSFVMEDVDDDGAGGTDSRLEVTAGDGTYTIRVNSIESARTGSYRLEVQRVGAAGPAGTRTIAAGQRITERLTSSDPKFSDDSNYHLYRYMAEAGERLVITLDSDDFDTYLRWGRVVGSDVDIVENDDDGGSGTNSRLELTVAAAGTYAIIANSYSTGGLGAYTLAVESARGGGGPALSALPLNGQVGGRLESSDPVLPDNTHYKLYVYRGSPGERVVFTMRSSDFDAYLSGGQLAGARFEAEQRDDDSGGGTDAQLVATIGESGSYVLQVNSLGPATGSFTLMAQPVDGAVATGATAGQRTIRAGGRVSGRLSRSTPMLPDSSHYDQYLYSGRAGDRIRITLRSTDFDAYLRWGRVNGDRFQSESFDDDGAGGTDSQLEVTVGGTGTYAIQANSYEAGQTGSYTLTVEPLSAAAAPAVERGSTSMRGKWLPSFRESSNPAFRQLGQRVRQQQTLQQVSDALNARFALPRNVPILVAECGEVNAFYSPRETHVIFCYELLQHLARTFVRDNAWTTAQQEAVDGAMRFILMHEVGHALVDVLDLPITGREEDAVDQLAAVMLIESGEKGAQAAMNGVRAIQSGSRDFAELELAGEHSLGPQRLYNVACWIYGSDPQKYRAMVSSGQLPESRADRCPSEYERLQKAWTRILRPHQG